MPLTLSPQTQQMVEEKLKQGHYHSADEIVQAALSALNELENTGLDEETLDAIDEAEAQIARGEVYDLDEVEKRLRAKSSTFKQPQ